MFGLVIATMHTSVPSTKLLLKNELRLRLRIDAALLLIHASLSGIYVHTSTRTIRMNEESLLNIDVYDCLNKTGWLCLPKLRKRNKSSNKCWKTEKIRVLQCFTDILASECTRL